MVLMSCTHLRGSRLEFLKAGLKPAMSQMQFPLSLFQQTLVKSQLLQEALGRAVVVPPLIAAVMLANLLDARVSVGHEKTDGFPNGWL